MNLPIHNLSQRHFGLTDAIGNNYTEAARVCLDRHHSSPVGFVIENTGQRLEVNTEWQQTDNRTKGAWANETDATEAGAYACVLAAVEIANGMVAVHRAETKTGADYYISNPDNIADLENCLRLEVSGVDKGDESIITQRLKEKIKQAASGASNLPAIAGVVGFRARIIFVMSVEQK